MYSFAEGPIGLPRDYRLFSALAGVRSASDGIPPLVSPRGFPVHACSSTLSAFYLYVRDADETHDSLFDEVTREVAEAAVARGVAHFRDHYTKPRGFVSDPSWHAPSWLDAGEFRRSLENHGLTATACAVEVQVLLSAMQPLEQHYGIGRSRIVFWFDN